MIYNKPHIPTPDTANTPKRLILECIIPEAVFAVADARAEDVVDNVDGDDEDPDGENEESSLLFEDVPEDVLETEGLGVVAVESVVEEESESEFELDESDESDEEPEEEPELDSEVDEVPDVPEVEDVEAVAEVPLSVGKRLAGAFAARDAKLEREREAFAFVFSLTTKTIPFWQCLAWLQ